MENQQSEPQPSVQAKEGEVHRMTETDLISRVFGALDGYVSEDEVNMGPLTDELIQTAKDWAQASRSLDAERMREEVEGYLTLHAERIEQLTKERDSYRRTLLSIAGDHCVSPKIDALVTLDSYPQIKNNQ